MLSHKAGLSGLFSLMLLATLLLSACMQDSRAGKVYSRDQARVTHSVYYGTVLRVEDVAIEGTSDGAGTLAGGAMGGVLGSTIGGGSGRAIGAVGGAILGGLAGAAVEKDLTTTQGVELEVELDNGELLAIVQEKDAEYRVGDRVRVLRDAHGAARVRQ
jgi:outer membrane lipoprotein SlyB